MPNLSTNEIELLTFFEVEPEVAYPDIPWIYRESIYQVVQGDLALTFSIYPSYGNIGIVLRQGDHVIYELQAKGVHDLHYFNEKGLESIRLELHEDEFITIRLKPRVEFQHQYSESP